MNEPHTDFAYPTDAEDEPASANAAKHQGFRLGLFFFAEADTANLPIRQWCIQQLLHPGTESVTAAAKRLGASRVRLYRHLRNTKSALQTIIGQGDRNP